jgi:hypothetical protein
VTVCILGTPEQHIESCAAEAAGVDQWNIHP